MKSIILAFCVLSLGVAGQAAASSKTEDLSVAGGAVAGALAGGPLGMIVGAAIGAHYGVVREGRNEEAARADSLDRDLRAARGEIDASRGQVSMLTSELDRSREDVAELSAEVQELVRDQAMLAELRFDVLFRTNATELGAADRSQIALLAKFMKRHPDLRVRLHGHTDIRGGETYNDDLSRGRVAAVAGLLADLDIEPDRIEHCT